MNNSEIKEKILNSFDTIVEAALEFSPDGLLQEYLTSEDEKDVFYGNYILQIKHASKEGRTKEEISEVLKEYASKQLKNLYGIE